MIEVHIFKRIPLFFVFVFSICNTIAQEEATSFDTVFNHVIFNVIRQDAVQAKYITDSLLEHAINGRQRIKGLMLLANLSIQSNDHEEALVYALRAEDIAKKEKDYEWQLRTAGFLSAIFRDANLIAEAREHLKVVEAASKKVKKSIDYDLIKINIHHERAHFEWKDGNFEKAILELQSAQKYIPLLKEKMQAGFFSNNYLMLGENYLDLQEYEKAAEYFHLALDNKVPNENLNYSAIYRGLGEIELQKKSYDQAIDYLKLAEEYIPSNQHFSASIPVYKSLSNYHKEISLLKEAMHYDSLYLQGIKTRASFTEKLSDRLVQNRLTEQSFASKRSVILYGTSGSLAALVLLLFVRLRMVRRKERRRYEAFVQKQKSVSPPLRVDRDRVLRKNTTSYREEPIMPLETEQRLLNELEKLEGNNFFTRKDISLAVLATQLQTNTRYLSYIVNTYKGKDFSNYIHDLRIEFALDKLQNDPRYLKYKIAYLAEECGFSSHSKFTSVFKSITGVSPSVFVSFIKREREG